MKLRLVLSISFFLYLGVFLAAQTLKEFPKRISIEAGFSQHLLPAEEYLIDALQNAGYLRPYSSEFNRRVPYFMAQFRLNDQFSVGFKISKMHGSDYFNAKDLPYCMRPWPFPSAGTIDSTCSSSLQGWIHIYPVDYNEFQLKWHNPKNKFGVHSGIVFYKYGYRFSADYDLSSIGNLEHTIFDIDNKGVGASLGGFVNLLSLGKRLHLIANAEYYLIPIFTIERLDTLIGTFSETKVNLSQLNIGLGIKLVLL